MKYVDEGKIFPSVLEGSGKCNIWKMLDFTHIKVAFFRRKQSKKQLTDENPNVIMLTCIIVYISSIEKGNKR